MQDIQFDKLKKAFEHSPIPFALLDSTLATIYSNSALSQINGCEPLNLFKSMDKDNVLNHLKTEKAYEFVYDLPDMVSLRFTLTALFSESESDELIGAAAIIHPDMPLSQNPFFSADDNECQMAINRELRDRISVMFTSIYALSQLSELDKSHRVCEYINSINQNCYQLLRVSDNLAKIMRLSAQNDFANFRLVDFSQYLKKLILTVVHLDNKNLIPIHFSCPDEVIPVKLDLERMEFAIVNILLNSLKYTRDGNEVSVSLKSDGKNAVVSICDKGAGIPKNILHLVGTPYFSYSHGGKFEAGFGVGLNIAKRYIAAHSGLFSIQSVEGEGTTVTFSIPIDSSDATCGGTDFLSSPPDFSPERKFSQTLIQLSEVCYYPAL